MSKFEFNTDPIDPTYLFYKACMTGDTQSVTKLIKNGIDVNVFKGFESPLHAAVRSNYIEVVKILLNNNADPNIAKGSPPFHDNSDECGHMKIINYLVGHTIDENALNFVKQSPLFKAIVYKDLKLYDLLVIGRRRFCDYCIPPLNVAVYHGYQEIMELLLKHQAQINSRDYNGNTPLHVASSVGLLSSMNILLNHSANLNDKNNKSFTPLQVAIHKGHLEAVKFLINQGAHTDGDDLMESCSYDGTIEIVEYFVQKGYNVNHKNLKQQFQSPLLNAASNLRLDLIELLVQKGADINIQDQQGHTALHHACLEDINFCPDLVPFLLESKIDINCKDVQGNAPLHVAVYRGQEEIAALLINNGCEVNIKNNDGTTPFHCACDKRFLCIDDTIIKILLLAGADYNIKDNNGDTPIQWLSDDDQQETVIKMIEEMKEMESIELNNSYTLCDILKMKMHVLIRYTNNDSLMQLYDDCGSDFRKRFENFGTLLNSQIEKASKRKLLMESVKDVMQRQFQFRIPDTCRYDIFMYLTNEDLEKLSK